MLQRIKGDVIIVGAGLAGIRAAIAAQKKARKIILVTKGKLFSAGSSFCNRNNRWGMTFASTDEECGILLARINAISQGTNIPGLSEILVAESFSAFQEVARWGIKFLPAEGSRWPHRIPPCFCSTPLAAIISSIRQTAIILAKQLEQSRIICLEKTRATSLLTEGGVCRGILARQQKDEYLLEAPATIVASGGNAACFTPNIVEPGLTGDGYTLLQQAGLSLSNMDFLQRVWEDIDPTARRFPFSALLDNQYFFLNAANGLIDLSEVPSTLMDFRKMHVPISNLQADRKFDSIFLRHLSTAFDSAIRVYAKDSKNLKNRIYPHVQASNGGIKIDERGGTGIQGLFAAGEVTTGMHGGDRIGGMMITNCLVFGKRAGEAAAHYARQS